MQIGYTMMCDYPALSAVLQGPLSGAIRSEKPPIIV
jgi:hypothetical protein